MQEYDFPEPSKWHWGCGEVAGESKTYWFYSNLRFHYRGELYTDPGNPWTVNIYPETGLLPGGDVKVSEYADKHQTFDEEVDAIEFIYDSMDELLNY